VLFFPKKSPRNQIYKFGYVSFIASDSRLDFNTEGNSNYSNIDVSLIKV